MIGYILEISIFLTSDIVVPDIEHATRRNNDLLPYQQVIIALKYHVLGTFCMISQLTAYQVTVGN